MVSYEKNWPDFIIFLFSNFSCLLLKIVSCICKLAVRSHLWKTSSIERGGGLPKDELTLVKMMTKGDQKSQKIDDVFYERPLTGYVYKKYTTLQHSYICYRDAYFPLTHPVCIGSLMFMCTNWCKKLKRIRTIPDLVFH